MTAGRERADRLLVDLGLADSRARARALILDGKVRVDGRPVAKPGQMLARAAHVELTEPDHPWVSRGGLKLQAALEQFQIDPAGKVALDLGASTGGFTDVLLARGAARIYAVDVGHGQLHPRLAADPRVIALEGINARTLDRALIPEPSGLVVCDVSFIGLRTALPAALALAAPGAALVALVKPQFEAGPESVGKGGVVRDEAVRRRTVETIVEWLEGEMGWAVAGVTDSPVAGSDGNREYLLAAFAPE